MSANNFDQIINVFENNSSFLLSSHSNPDGDAIGSMLAIGTALERRGKQVFYYNRDNVPSNLQFLPHSEKVTNELPKKADAGVLIDCAERVRASARLDDYEGANTWICVDHHSVEGVDQEISTSLVDSNAAATGVIVYELFKRWNEPITPDIATYIYCAIVVDTGFFRYPNTSSKIFKIAEELVNAGADPWSVSRNIDENFPASRIILMGYAFSTLELHLDKRFACLLVTQDMLKKSGATMEETDELAVYPRSIRNIEVSALFRELSEKRIKVSLRSKDSIDVAELALRFGGGGHMRASGCLIEGKTLEEAKALIINEVKKALP